LSGRTVPQPDVARRFASLLADLAGLDGTDRTDQLEHIAELTGQVRKNTRRLVVSRDPAATQRRIGAVERQSSLIRGVTVTTLPGWLQTEPYVRAVMGGDHRAAEQRLRNQRNLELTDRTRQWVAVIGEAALGWSRLPDHLMAEQLDHLAARCERPPHRIGVIPWGQQMPTLPPHSWALYDDRLILTGGLTWSLDLSAADDVAAYIELTDQVEAAAVWGEQARAIIAGAADRYRVEQ
jgi:hypothetical protein